ncbi:MAG: tRNA 2-thiocytidine(32) synthetase TtcA [Clostridia bacterium]|nr:tRNA 2-thiocytidine(32) synthetase TtcA [Clostridia bacterium]
MKEFSNIEHILSYARKAVEEYDMIENGDKIAVGVSGGKDSLTLLCALAKLKRVLPFKYELVAVTVDMGLPNSDFSKIRELCDELEIPYHVVKTQIYEIIFDVRKEKNPCALCARMRRGALHDAIKGLGCNKLALGHHYDDVVETFMLNLFFEGRVGCFRPVTYLSRKDITMIRPLIYTKEKLIKSFATLDNLPVVKSECPADGNTERARMKEYLAIFDKEHRGLYHRIMGAIQRGEIDGFHADKIDAEEKKRRRELYKLISEGNNTDSDDAE